MLSLNELLERSARDHDHLCPRQVLGVRMGVYAARLLALDLPQTDKRLFTFVETDGCFVDGVSAATGCTVGHRTMRIMDFGKAAATFVDTRSNTAVRIAPLAQARGLSDQYIPDAKSHWHAQLEAYQVMPDRELMAFQNVSLTVSLEAILSKPGIRVNCDLCKEEIINEREVRVDGRILCKSCAGMGYVEVLSEVPLPREIISSARHVSV
jgi:formylmethanofuran dehydrogenase subunit E